MPLHLESVPFLDLASPTTAVPRTSEGGRGREGSTDVGPRRVTGDGTTVRSFPGVEGSSRRSSVVAGVSRGPVSVLPPSPTGSSSSRQASRLESPTSLDLDSSSPGVRSGRWGGVGVGTRHGGRGVGRRPTSIHRSMPDDTHRQVRSCPTALIQVRTRVPGALPQGDVFLGPLSFPRLLGSTPGSSGPSASGRVGRHLCPEVGHVRPDREPSSVTQ